MMEAFSYEPIVFLITQSFINPYCNSMSQISLIQKVSFIPIENEA